MKTQVWLVTIFLVCGAVCQDQESNHSDRTSDIKIQNDQLQKSGMVVNLTAGNALTSSTSVKPVKSTPSPDVKVSTLKTETKVDVPSNHSDVLDMSGDTMFSRAAYLLTGISVLILLYFAWKSFSLRRRQTHIHKYGVVASREDLEMTSLGFGSEDEEDDTTHFDIGKHQRS